jgi:hypothetical protein
MNIIQNILRKSLLAFSLFTLFFITSPTLSYAQEFTGGGGTTRGAGGGRSTSTTTSTTSWSGTCVSNGDVATIQGFECLFANILKVVMGFAGLAFFAMLVVGGFKFITSGGDPKKMASASSTLTLAFVSVLGVIVSWLILLLIQNFTGVNVTQFKIGG